ncbi:MAG TPA: carbohydrate-binding protein [Bryobacteraceae bacterium]|nr:carbohydrate-binding protein [Bryobacteraceae bacterium]
MRFCFVAQVLLATYCLHGQTVSVWLTTDDQKTLLQPQQPVSFAPGASPTIPTIFVDDSVVYQSIEGFGASFTDSSAWLMAEKIPAGSLDQVMHSLFDHSKGIGISFVRNPMGASDLARSDYSYDDVTAGVTDPSLNFFHIDHDRVDIIPLLQKAKLINADLKVMATPWSAPGWMKSTGSMIGGTLNPANYDAFAKYFVRYLQAYSDAGVPVDYISPQNEPLFVPTDYPGMSMPAADQLTILRDHLLPALAANRLSTKVLIYDHNWDAPAYPQTLLADASISTSSQIGGIAWHWYGGTPGAMSLLHNQHPNLNNYVTEASGGTWISDEVRADFETIIQSMRNWSSAFVKWGMALDENRGPHTGGCGTCTGLITVNQSSGAVTYNVDYYTLGHFSQFVLPGAVRIYSSNATGIVDAAFLNRDGSETLVVFNDSSSSRTFQISSHQRSLVYTIPGFSGASFVWPSVHIASRRFHHPAYGVTAVSQQIQASSYTDMSGLETEATSDTDGGYDLGYSVNGSWAEYRNIDFSTGVNSVNVRMASGGIGGKLEFHLDSLTGPLVGTATLPVTGGWQSWTTVTAPIVGARGIRNLFLLFRGSETSGSVANLNWLQFH